MIDLKKYKKILDSGLLLDHYLVLCQIRDGAEILKNRRTQGFINLLNKKGYIDEGTLTDVANDLISDSPTIVTSVSTTTTIESSGTLRDYVDSQFDYGGWVVNLHKKCQNKLVELTGKSQVRDKIDRKTYPFLPNATDLGKVLYRAIVAYKLTDMDKIEKCILSYIDKCHRARNWFPILGYYVMKMGVSQMVTDMESIDDDDKGDGKSLQKFV